MYAQLLLHYVVATPRHLDCPFLSANKHQPSLRFFFSSLRYSNLVLFSLISQPLSRPGQGSRWSRGGGFLVLDIGDRKFRYPRKIPRTKARLDRTPDDDPVYPLPLCWFLREFYLRASVWSFDSMLGCWTVVRSSFMVLEFVLDIIKKKLAVGKELYVGVYQKYH